MSKARARGAARKGVTEELDVIAEESDGEEGEAQAARVLAGLEKLDSVLEVVTRSEQVAATQGAALANTVASVQALSEQVAKLAQAQAAASVSTPRGRAERREGAHGRHPTPPPEARTGEGVDLTQESDGGEGAGGAAVPAGLPLGEDERAELGALEARLNSEELQAQLAALEKEKVEWEKRERGGSRDRRKKKKKKKKKKSRRHSSSDSSSSDSSDSSDPGSETSLDEGNPGVPYVPGVLPRPERLYRKGEQLGPCEVIRDTELQLALGIDNWNGLQLGARRELATTYGLAGRLADLKVGIEKGASQEDVYATVCGLQGFLLPRVQGCLRVADAGGNPQKLALVRALQEALHEERNALPAMGSEWKRIDKESRKAMWRAASKASGAAAAAAFTGARSAAGGDGLSNKQRKSRAWREKKGWRGPGWLAKNGGKPGGGQNRG